MKSPEEQNLEATVMAQGPFGHVDSKKDAKQEVAARSCMQRARWFCKRQFLRSAVGQQYHHGTFPHEQCPSEWLGYKKKCYFISEEEKDWTSSQAFCTKNNALLVVFENQEEMRFLAKHLRIDDSWIGLRKKDESFFWENGTALNVDFFLIWNHSECAYLNASTISTSACSLPRRSICMQLPQGDDIDLPLIFIVKTYPSWNLFG